MIILGEAGLEPSVQIYLNIVDNSHIPNFLGGQSVFFMVYSPLKNETKSTQLNSVPFLRPVLFIHDFIKIALRTNYSLDSEYKQLIDYIVTSGHHRILVI